jgi:hypothetical protein
MTAGDVATELRRRREAANRCQPLETGYRDPLDRLAAIAPRTTYRPVTVTVDGRVILIRGRVRDTLRSVGLKPLWSAVTRAFVLDVGKLPDALAALQHAGLSVDVRERGAA